MTHRSVQIAVCAIALSSATACSLFGSNNELPKLGNKVVGEACTKTLDCIEGLVCAANEKCADPQDPGTGQLGDACGKSDDCAIEFVCAGNGSCAPPGAGVEGAPCAGNQSCKKGLVCSGALQCQVPGSPNTKLAGEACSAATECAFGLICLESKCTALAIWNGVSCGPNSAEPLKALFSIPRSGKLSKEFYALPFPNDIRKKNGKVDVSGHPAPGDLLPAEYGNIVGEYLKRINQDVSGFSLVPTVYLRTSALIDYKTLKLDGDSPTVQFVNIDKSSSAYGNGVSYNMFAESSATRYICQNRISLRPSSTLLPNSTYAALLRSGITNSEGQALVADQDFKVVVSDTEPSDSDEKAAWQAYAPLRSYLKDKGIDPATVVSAAVFTTGDPQAKLPKLREAVRARAMPTLNQVTLCDGTAKSPCDDGSDANHRCPSTPDPAFYELHARYKTPVFQSGSAPYKTAADGGKIDYDANGLPKFVRDDDVCVVITIPKGTMPSAGWPVALYAHGTGGSLRSFIDNGTAKALADIKDGTNAVAQIAAISIDGSMHGPRRNSSDPPDQLFFNLRNPAAARDNVYQGAIDKFQLIRVIEALALDSSASPTGAAIQFDATKIFFYGHSQGTVEGIPFAAHEPLVRAVVLSGAGGHLITSLLNKKKPIEIATLLKFALVDPELDSGHPLLNLLQLYFDEVDALHYAKSFLRTVPSGNTAKDLLLGYGVADSFTPPATIIRLARELGVPQVDQPAERCGDGVCSGSETCNSCSQDCSEVKGCGPVKAELTLIAPPVSGNIKSVDGPITAAMCPHVSDGSYDDHHVLSQNPAAKNQVMQFLGTAVRDGTPTIVAP
ncbi:MAG: hypothetical protein H6707_02080 [Deltaproteobacteria bacterium]|nr:hypothetical protein [Deltaproteobacteria bacterium]